MALYLYPRLFLIVTFLIMTFAAFIGDWLRSKLPLEEDQRKDFDLVLGSSLTLLGLLIGFSFSMATSRYDQRKHYEAAEANTIATEYLRADLLPGEDAAKVKGLLRLYLDQRIQFCLARDFAIRDSGSVALVNRQTAILQKQLWQSVRPQPAMTNAVGALVIAGMNDVFNSQGYTQAAWWNRIPEEAWLLMLLIGLACSAMISYAAHRRNWKTSLILPTAVALSLFLIADIESPRRGFIHVTAQNLVSLARTIDGK